MSKEDKPRFHIMDLQNYTPEFLQEIVLWQESRIKELEESKDKPVHDDKFKETIIHKHEETSTDKTNLPIANMPIPERNYDFKEPENLIKPLKPEDLNKIRERPVYQPVKKEVNPVNMRPPEKGEDPKLIPKIQPPTPPQYPYPEERQPLQPAPVPPEPQLVSPPEQQHVSKNLNIKALLLKYGGWIVTAGLIIYFMYFYK